MNQAKTKPTVMEQMLAFVLYWGTWVGAALIGIGLLLGMFKARLMTDGLELTSSKLLTAGVAALVFLPFLRVGVMVIQYLRERNRLYSAIAGLVLSILCVGVLFGIHGRG